METEDVRTGEDITKYFKGLSFGHHPIHIRVDDLGDDGFRISKYIGSGKILVLSDEVYIDKGSLRDPISYLSFVFERLGITLKSPILH